MRRALVAGAAVLCAGAALGAAASAQRQGGGLPQGGERVTLDPADFTTRITNPYWPMRVGSRWVYRETDSEGTRQKVVVTVTPRTKLIANGVRARVVRDVVTEKGVPVEVTDDWYAQDRAGNVWYLGEATTEYEDGKPVSTEGSFEAGVDGAEAGVIMPARPRPGLRYRQEYYEGRGRGPGPDREPARAGRGPRRPLPARADDPRREPARAEGARVQVLRPRGRPSARRERVGRQRPRGARALQEERLIGNRGGRYARPMALSQRAPAERPSARERILDTSYELFSAHGIRAVGIDRIIAESGVAKMSLYRHFSSKDELVLAFLARREERWTVDWLKAEVERREPPGPGRLLAIFDVFGEWFVQPDFEGCSFINVLLEFDDRDHPIRHAAVAHLSVIRGFVCEFARSRRASAIRRRSPTSGTS